MLESKIIELVKLKANINRYLNNLKFRVNQEYQKENFLNKIHNLIDEFDDILVNNNITNIKDQTKNIIKQSKNDLLDLLMKEVTISKEQIENDLNKLVYPLLKREVFLDNKHFLTAMKIEDERKLRSQILPSELKEQVIAKIRLFTSSKYAALEIGPGDGIWTEHLVAADPLYILDLNDEYIQSTLSKFNPVYQRRMRTYKGTTLPVFEYDLSFLPQFQFGFILAWNVFDYYPFEFLMQYITSCHDLLRPGGMFLFSFNDCDNTQNALAAVSGDKSWMTISLLQKILDKNNMILHDYIVYDNYSFVLVGRQGTLSTVKAHQALGEIIRKN